MSRLGRLGCDGVGALLEEGYGGEDLAGGHVAHDDFLAVGGELGQLDAAGFHQEEGFGGLFLTEEDVSPA